MTARMRWALAALLLGTALAYWPGLSGPLVFDDAPNLAPVAQWQQGAADWRAVVFGNDSGRLGRPVAMASFVLNVLVSGDSLWGLKLGNLLLHLANGALVFALFTALLRAGALAGDPRAGARWLPLLGAAVWLLHPLLVSTVLYVVQRMAMLSALFILVAMLAYVLGRLALDAGDRRRAWRWLALVPTATVLAGLSKENGVLAPSLCAVIELVVFAPRPGVRRALPSRFVVGLGLVAPVAVAVALVAVQHPLLAEGYANRSFSLWERLLTQPRALWDYVAALLLPQGPRLGLYHDDFPVSRGLLDPPATAAALVAWLAVVAAAWRWRRAVPGLALGLGIFLVGHGLESTIFPLLMYFEHRNYLPAVGAVWALLALATVAGRALSRHMHQPGRVAIAGAVGVALVLALATAGRAGVWQSQRALLAQGLEHHPTSRWLRMDLAREAMQAIPPDYDAARRHSAALRPAADPSTRRLAAASRLLIDCHAGVAADPSSLKAAFSGLAAVIEPDLLVPFEALADSALAGRCRGLEAGTMAPRLAAMLDASPLPPRERSVWRLRFKAAQLHHAAGHLDDALAQARLAMAGGRVEAPVPLFIAGVLLSQGKHEQAADALLRAERLMSPHDQEGQRLLRQYGAEIARRRLRIQ